MAVTKSTDPIDILLEMGIDLDNLSEEEDYLSALKEAIAKIQFQTKGAGDERSAILSQEVIKVRKSRKAADPKFKAKTTKVSPDAFFNKKKPEEKAQPVPGQKALPGKGPAAIVKRQTIKPELFKKTEGPEEQKDNKDIKVKENNILEDILKTLNSILGTLKKQNKLSTKQAEKDRKAKEKKKRGSQEEKLESPIKKFLGAANKIVKPVKSFLDGLLEFFVKVFIGRLLVKLIRWGSENGDKVDAILGFFEKTWPALLAVGLLFFTGLGGFIGNLIGLVAGFIPRLLGLVPKVLKGAMGLIKFVATNPFAAGALLFGAGAIIPKLFPDTVDAEEKKTEAAPGTNEEKIKALEEQKANLNPLERLQGVGAEIDEQIEFLKTGETAQYGKKFNKGGVVPGSGNTDSVRAMLTPGEFVMSKGAVQQYGLDTMKSMNAAGGGTNIPMVSNGITYAAGGGEVKNPDAELKANDEPKDRPKGDHSHELGHILGLDKIGGMISGFAKTPIGNALMPGVGPALSIAETLMGGGKPKARELSAREKFYQSPTGQYHQRRREQNREARERILTTTDVLPDGTIRTQGEGTLVAGELYDPNNPTEMQKAVLALSGQMGNPAPAAPAASTPAPVTATPKTPAAPAPTITEQPKEKGRGLLSMYAGYLDFMTGNVFDIDQMGRPGDEKGPVNDKDKAREGADGEEKEESGSTLSETQQKALQVLAKYESGAAGYDAVNQIGTKGGRGVKGFSGDIKQMPQHKGRSLTDFTIAEIKQLQYDDRSMSDQQWIQAGKLHAVGAYQFIGNTLPGVAKRAGIPDSAKFTPAVQDLMALQLMKERGISPWVGPSDKATAAERAIIEQARREPISYDKTSGGGAIKSFGGSTGSFTPAGPGGSIPGPSGGPSGPGGSTPGPSGSGKTTGRFKGAGGAGSVGNKTSYGDYLKSLYGKKKSADSPSPTSTTPKGKSSGSSGFTGGKTSKPEDLQKPSGNKKSADGITPLPSSTMSKGKSAGGPSADAGKNPGNQMTSPDNNIPAINAEAMHSDEKIEVLGIEIS